MNINFDGATKSFHLQTENTSYIMQIHKDGYLAHLYWGKRLRKAVSSELLSLKARGSFSPNPDNEDDVFTLDTFPQEYPAYGNTDYRMPAYEVQLENGTTVTDLRFDSYKILKGKPVLKGLPSTYVENEAEALTLEILMLDALIGLKVLLSYTVFDKHDAITRSVRFINDGTTNLKLLRTLSMSVDFNVDKYEFMQLSGAWGRERHIERIALNTGNKSIESRRGASGHQQNPFIALLRRDTTEEHGEVYGFSLVYSGNFLAQAEIDQYSTTRVSMGINPFGFSWLLEPLETFQTPEVVMVYSSEGIGKMSRTYHKLYRTRLCRGKFRDATRPVVINNWEATYFDFNAKKVEDIAKVGKELGIELFVLDDGWFGKRDNDKTSLGDWVVNKNKLPKGLDNLANRVNNLGLQFGLWFEPEMISPDSDLYRLHPDWCIHVPNRTRSLGRTQLILDLSRSDVCDYIIDAVSSVLRSAKVSYVKWDMNRNMTEIGSALLPPERQRETAHRYILGLYSVMETITTSFPNILFESCSGGGGRFDPGILFYMPQTWTSDDTDAVERLKIQYGTSVVYPVCTMGCHVSDVPNHQVARNTSLKMRGDVAMFGNFGYELDLTNFSDSEKEQVKHQISKYKQLRELIQHGDLYRLLSPFAGNETAWMFVSEDKSEAFISYFKVLAMANEPTQKLALRGLNPDIDYNIIGKEGFYGGDELMYSGLNIPDLNGDYCSITWSIVGIR
ncbi:alpha-galactosidase [Clostridium sp. CF012]|uniref:alpha-galactosidase n=1 Tax=Clostridium sp. CF012 TaxID=2843319 RepID=UPI001C0CE5E2|nr:alpha-galactosidase [Clostridium sp. CF012]MBU3145180.1 alpha-galactosidase [Clostridium sp. CF012]